VTTAPDRAGPSPSSPRPSTPSLERERAVAIAAVRAAARVTRAVRSTFDPSLAATKDDRSPVTVADLAAQVLVSRALAQAFPDDPLVAEEDAGQLRRSEDVARAVARFVAAQIPDLADGTLMDALERGGGAGGPSGRWWTLDPVDGTKGFLRGGQYAVALALVQDGRPVIGVLGCPNLGSADGSRVGALFVAERGHGAWELPLDVPPAEMLERPLTIRVAEGSDPRRARLAESVEGAHSDVTGSALVAERLGIASPPLRMDSQAKYAVVARGEASIYLRIPHAGYRENVWDHAAGALIVEEAGGTVTDIEGRALDFTTGRRLTANRGVLAAPEPLHAAVLAALAAVVRGNDPATWEPNGHAPTQG
jgi:3'(2'), 5'-bisphosphate nucleotidase